MSVASFRRVSKWLGIGIAVLGAGCVLIFAGVVWFGNYMSEGVVETATLQGNVLVALSNDPPVRQALLSGCQSTQGFPAPTSALLSSGLLVEIPSGTKMHMPSWGEDRQVGTMTISEGKLKGHQVWVCWGQFALMHAMP